MTKIAKPMYEEIRVPDDNLTELDITGLLLQKYVEGSEYDVETKTWTVPNEKLEEILRDE